MISGIFGLPAPNGPYRYLQTSIKHLTGKLTSMPSTGLIPQAPLHTQSLLIFGAGDPPETEQDRMEMGPMAAHGGKAPVLSSSNEKRGPTEIKRDIEALQEQLNVEKRVAVVEQRVSVLVQGLFCEIRVLYSCRFGESLLNRITSQALS
jgi:hypothetical protein